jgi:hypothetical protein
MNLTPDCLRLLEVLEEGVRQNLQDLRDSIFDWLLISTAVVIVGVALEGPEVIHETFIAWRSRKEAPRWMKLVAFAGWVLIVGGVAGEFILEGFVSQADGLVQSFDNIRLAETQRGAARAIVDAGWANERAAAANTETAELLAEIQPRHLTKEQYDAISDGLKPFSGRGFFIGSYWVDAEAARLARQIKTAINRAGLGTRNELLRTSTIDRIGQYPETLLSG